MAPWTPAHPKAAEELLPLVYDQLRRLAAHKMANERPGQTLQATAEGYGPEAPQLWDVESGQPLLAFDHAGLDRSPAEFGAVMFSPDGQWLLTATINLQTVIRPILRDSCADCHGGEEPKGNFKVVDRASLFQGGESGLATVVLGHGAESQLIRHVTDQIEDMEMPPPRKRDKYPKLTPAQVKALTMWIDEGAYRPAGLTLED